MYVNFSKSQEIKRYVFGTLSACIIRTVVTRYVSYPIILIGDTCINYGFGDEKFLVSVLPVLRLC